MFLAMDAPGGGISLLRAARVRARRRLGRLRWKGTEAFWEQHYVAGGDSGSGSFGQLAHFKADTLNRFILANDVESVIEFGCGDGNQLSLARYPRYVGLDVASVAIDWCIRRFADDNTKSFIHYDPRRWCNRGAVTEDLAISLEVIFNLVEDDMYERYMQHLLEAAIRWVIVYASNTDQPDPEQYVRHHRFTDWVEANQPQWQLVERIANPYPYDDAAPYETSFSDFCVFARTIGATVASREPRKMNRS